MTPISGARARFLDGAGRAVMLLGDGPARDRCEVGVAAFMEGVRRWSPEPGSLEGLDALEPFAWEGVGLAAALEGAFDATLARRPDRAALLLVGLGWSRALAGAGGTPPEAFEAWQARFGAEAWLCFDGQGYAHTLLRRRSRAGHEPEGEAATWFDQGCGRALYYVHGGRASAIDWAIKGLGRARTPALWRGVGIASRFTDGLDASSRAALRERGGAALRAGEQQAERLVGRPRIVARP